MFAPNIRLKLMLFVCNFLWRATPGKKFLWLKKMSLNQKQEKFLGFKEISWLIFFFEFKKWMSVQSHKYMCNVINRNIVFNLKKKLSLFKVMELRGYSTHSTEKDRFFKLFLKQNRPIFLIATFAGYCIRYKPTKISSILIQIFINVFMGTPWSWACKKMLLHGGNDSNRLKKFVYQKWTRDYRLNLGNMKNVRYWKFCVTFNSEWRFWACFYVFLHPEKVSLIKKNVIESNKLVHCYSVIEKFLRFIEISWLIFFFELKKWISAQTHKYMCNVINTNIVFNLKKKLSLFRVMELRGYSTHGTEKISFLQIIVETKPSNILNRDFCMLLYKI